uniref:Uncharacterized protein n=1 Tax=Mycena chlorophos TaxID=658473 RepID=A0ABQ0LE62_MYCCL|nr:predicted protein [Mycena chlorophos]
MSDMKLDLDPGPRRRPRMSFCKCLALTVTIPLACFLAWTLGPAVWKHTRHNTAPRRGLYHRPTPGAEGDPHNPPIYPLITDEQTFDILATVWLRGTGREEAQLRASRLAKLRPLHAPGQPPVLVPSNGAPIDDDSRIDQPLFSDIILRGRRLTNKHASAKINLTLPTARFMEKNLQSDDLRITFVLLPSSDLLIDHLRNYSSWRPPSMFWPMIQPQQDGAEKTIVDLALESFAISVPLLSFWNTTASSNCAPTNTSVETVGGTAISTSTTQSNPSIQRWYVDSRMQLRIINEQTIFNGAAYRAEHKWLQATACRGPSYRNCGRSYEKLGNLETLLELQVPPELNHTETEVLWMYAPYMHIQKVVGPQDYIPVTWANCTEAIQAPVPDFVNVTLNVAFAGRSPGKSALASAMSFNVFIHNGSDCVVMKQQRLFELWTNSEKLLNPARAIGFSARFILGLPYWWSRITTTGISYSGAMLVSTSYLLKAGIHLYKAYPDPRGGALVEACIAVSLPLIMLRAINRVEVGWNRRYPTFSRSPATHQERRSERIDNEVSWRAKLVLVLAGTLVYYFGRVWEIEVVAGFSSMECPSDTMRPMEEVFVLVLASALATIGQISQILLNHRMQTYAGSYRVAALLTAAGCIAYVLERVPAVVGRQEFREPLMLDWSLGALLQVLQAWQALSLPPVKVVEDDED